MPQSSHRHKHKHPVHHNPQQAHPVIKRKRSAALLMAVFIGLLGLIIGALASGMNYLWMTASASIGAIAGALIGHGIDRSISKRG